MRQKRLYTTEIHVQRLKRMLKRKNWDNCCPSASRFDEGKDAVAMWKNRPCKICREFVELPDYFNICPCFSAPKEIILEKTLKAIKEYE